MKAVLKVLGVCLGFFVFLSITIKEKPMFNHLYSVTSYVSIPAQNLTASLFNQAAIATTAYTKKLFDNSVPKVKDSVKSKVAGPVRGQAAVSEPEETILSDEKEELDQLIKSHRE